MGTGSGVLALAALLRGVPEAVGLDIDPDALQAAEENARLNGLEGRLRLVKGGPESVDGVWPIVMANLVAAPLIEMAPALVRRVGPAGRLVLSGIPSSVAREVDQAYRRCGCEPAAPKPAQAGPFSSCSLVGEKRLGGGWLHRCRSASPS